MWWRPSYNSLPVLEKFSRNTAGFSKYEQKPSARIPQHVRFNPENVIHTKAQKGEAMKWWHEHRMLIPDIPPENWKPPQRRGRKAWPRAWDETHAKKILSIPSNEIRIFLLHMLQKIIHEEVLSDGYDMREVDYEGKPLTDHPEMKIIETFVLEEQTLRDRVLRRVFDDELRIPLTSVDRKEIRSVDTLIRHVETILETYQEPLCYDIPPEVSEFLDRYPVQPRFGFQFALPQPTRGKLEREWERLFIHDWQYGKAVYIPRSKEKIRGNLIWLRLSKDWEDRVKHHEQYPELPRL